jgi:hypothetical protein
LINGQTIDNNNNYIHYNDTLLGMISYQQEQNQVDGEKSIMLNPNEQQRRDYKEQTLEAGEVYCIDMIMSTGDGKVINNEYNSKAYNCILIRLYNRLVHPNYVLPFTKRPTTTTSLRWLPPVYL